MKSSDAINDILQTQNKTKKSLASELGITPQALDSRMKASIKVETLAKTVEPLGFKIVLVSSDKTVDGYWLDS